MLRRQRHGADGQWVRRVAMKIRTTGAQAAAAVGQRGVLRHRLGRVVRVIHLDRIEPGGEQFFDAAITQPGAARVRQRDQPSGSVHDSDDDLRRCPVAGDECWTAGAEPTLERFPAACHVTGSNHRVGDLRPADRSTARHGGGRHRCDINRHSELTEAANDSFDTSYPRLPLHGEEILQLPVIDVKEVAEHVNVPARFDGRDFDAWHCLDPVSASGIRHLTAGLDRVVIGDGEHRHAIGGSQIDERRRRQTAVGRSRVKVEIDHLRFCDLRFVIAGW